jgi:PKD repeat protein
MFCGECGIYDQENFGGQRIYNNYFNSILNVKLGPGEGGNTWNTSLTQGTNIAGGPYTGGNFWAKPDGTGFSQTSVDMDENGIGDLPYNIYENEFDYLPLVSLSSPQNPVIPTANFTSSITNGTAPLLVQFTDFSENAIEWNWDFGDGTNSREQNPVHTYLVAGNYTVTLTVSNIEGIDSKLSTITVLGPVLPAEPPVKNAANISAPVNVQIGNLSQNANEINWNIGSQHLGTNFSVNGQNVSNPVTVQIGNVSQNANTINWNIYSV